ncbi:hypothetical protein KR018_002200 [Drosophila ironensis]|nr:hypothetical protein KR018_002200 [Drosophila ironensis]
MTLMQKKMSKANIQEAAEPENTSSKCAVATTALSPAGRMYTELDAGGHVVSRPLTTYECKLEDDVQQLQDALFTISSHYSKVQLRLRQISSATDGERNGLLRELERMTTQGLDGCTSAKEEQLPSLQLDSSCLGSVRSKQHKIISQLRGRLEDLAVAAGVSFGTDFEGSPDGTCVCGSREAPENKRNSREMYLKESWSDTDYGKQEFMPPVSERKSSRRDKKKERKNPKKSQKRADKADAIDAKQIQSVNKNGSGDKLSQSAKKNGLGGKPGPKLAGRTVSNKSGDRNGVKYIPCQEFKGLTQNMLKHILGKTKMGLACVENPTSSSFLRKTQSQALPCSTKTTKAQCVCSEGTFGKAAGRSVPSRIRRSAKHSRPISSPRETPAQGPSSSGSSSRMPFAKARPDDERTNVQKRPARKQKHHSDTSKSNYWQEHVEASTSGSFPSQDLVSSQQRIFPDYSNDKLDSLSDRSELSGSSDTGSERTCICKCTCASQKKAKRSDSSELGHA